VEVDGPSHFFTNLQRERLGGDKLREQYLEHKGWTVRKFCFFFTLLFPFSFSRISLFASLSLYFFLSLFLSRYNFCGLRVAVLFFLLFCHASLSIPLDDIQPRCGDDNLVSLSVKIRLPRIAREALSITEHLRLSSRHHVPSWEAQNLSFSAARFAYILDFDFTRVNPVCFGARPSTAGAARAVVRVAPHANPHQPGTVHQTLAARGGELYSC
jgi:hypothetical protein